MLFLDLFFHQWGPPLTSAATEAQAVMHFRIGFSQQIFLRFAAVKTCGDMAESGNSSHWGNGGWHWMTLDDIGWHWMTWYSELKKKITCACMPRSNYSNWTIHLWNLWKSSPLDPPAWWFARHLEATHHWGPPVWGAPGSRAVSPHSNWIQMGMRQYPYNTHKLP